jgi:hypothetical protein
VRDQAGPYATRSQRLLFIISFVVYLVDLDATR